VPRARKRADEVAALVPAPGWQLLSCADGSEGLRLYDWALFVPGQTPGMRRRSLDGMNLDDLPRMEFAFPGPLRDRLVAAILSGAKTATTGLVLENEPLPEVGQLLAVVDSADRRVAAIEVTQVRVIRLADVGLQHALDEGEGDKSVAEWRAGHENFWHSAEVRDELGDPHFTVNDDTLVLAQRFRLVNYDE
jgi:uncharacterized protein YhfF